MNEREQDFRDIAEVVSMVGFVSYATATKQVLPQAQAGMNPFHVVHLARQADCGSKVTAADDRWAAAKEKRSFTQGPKNAVDQD